MTVKDIEKKLGNSIVEYLRNRRNFIDDVGLCEAEYPPLFSELDIDESEFIIDYLDKHQEIIEESCVA